MSWRWPGFNFLNFLMKCLTYNRAMMVIIVWKLTFLSYHVYQKSEKVKRVTFTFDKDRINIRMPSIDPLESAGLIICADSITEVTPRYSGQYVVGCKATRLCCDCCCCNTIVHKKECVYLSPAEPIDWTGNNKLPLVLREQLCHVFIGIIQ